MSTHESAVREIELQQARDAVARGVEFIRRLVNGPQMLARIGENVDIGDAYVCALAQATGMRYSDATHKYDVRTQQAPVLGFMDSATCSIASLNQAWREWVASRT